MKFILLTVGPIDFINFFMWLFEGQSVLKYFPNYMLLFCYTAFQFTVFVSFVTMSHVKNISLRQYLHLV